MRLTAFTDYSLRVLMHLAVAPGGRATIHEIAQAYGISENHLMKVAHFLGREGLLDTLRGRGGGLALALPPSRIVLGRVVRATEGGSMPAECFDAANNACAITRQCTLRHVLADAVAAFYGVLDRHTLADVVRDPRALQRVLFAAPGTDAPAVKRRASRAGVSKQGSSREAAASPAVARVAGPTDARRPSSVRPRSSRTLRDA